MLLELLVIGNFHVPMAPPPRRAPKATPRALSSTGGIDSLLQRIVDFYAGRPVSVSTQEMGGTLGRADTSQGTVHLNPDIRKAFDAFTANYGTEKGIQDGIDSLGTVIHEALHNRGPDLHDSATGRSPRDPKTGGYSWDDEWQAHQLSFNLVPDAMQRFFGVKFDSPLGQRYFDYAKGRGYHGNLGGPPAQSPIGQRTTRW